MSNLTKSIAILGVVAGLGVAALPLSTYADTTDGLKVTDAAAEGEEKADGTVEQDTTIKLTIEDLLSIETSTEDVDLTNDSHTGSVDVTVVTRNSKGYNLNMKGSATTNPTSLTNKTGDQIVKGDGTFTNPVALDNTTASQWGYSIVDNEAFTAGAYAGVSEEGDTIYTQGTPTAEAGKKTTVNFAASLKDGQAAGEYEGKVTFTATNKAN